MSTPFDIPITQPSSGGGGGSLPFSCVSTQEIETILDPSRDGKEVEELRLTITPTSETQHVYLAGQLNGEWNSTSISTYTYGYVIIKRKIGTGSYVSLAPTNSGNRTAVNAGFPISNRSATSAISPEIATFIVSDEPETTSEIQYSVWVTNSIYADADFYLNRMAQNADDYSYPRFKSAISAQCFEP